jgi:DNA polymerase-3 subunit beta
MKFTIKKDYLLESLNHVAHALSSKNLIPILAGIKIDCLKEGIYLTANNNDIAIKTFIDKKEIANYERLGSIVIYGRYLLDIVRKLPNEFINFEVLDGIKVVIYTDNTNLLYPIYGLFYIFTSSTCL